MSGGDDVIRHNLTEAVKLIAGRVGIELDAEQVVQLAERGAALLVGLVDTSAKQAAAKAGDDAAASITTEDQAEAALREKP